MQTFRVLLISGLLASAGCSGGGYVQRAPAGTPVVSSSPALAATAGVRITLSAAQTAAVRAYFEPQNGNSRGRGRGNALPPGIAKNLARGKPLPPGIARQYLPADLVVTLPSLGNGLDYVVAAGKLLLVETATQVVRQVLIETLYG